MELYVPKRENGVVHLLLTREQWEAKHAALSLL